MLSEAIHTLEYLIEWNEKWEVVLWFHIESFTL